MGGWRYIAFGLFTVIGCDLALGFPDIRPDERRGATQTVTAGAGGASPAPVTVSVTATSGGGGCAPCVEVLLAPDERTCCPGSCELREALFTCACLGVCQLSCPDFCGLGSSPSDECQMCMSDHCIEALGDCLTDG